MVESKSSLFADERVWYDQFTSTDWVHDSILDAYRIKNLRARKDFRGRIKAAFDGTQGWILSALVGCITAVMAYIVDVSEAPVFDWKDGYCSRGFFISEKVRSGRIFLGHVVFNITRHTVFDASRRTSLGGFREPDLDHFLDSLLDMAVHWEPIPMVLIKNVDES